MANLVISSSLNPKSRSRLLALIAFKKLKDMGVAVEWLDLADHTIPLCDGDSTYNHSKVKELKEKVQHAKGILFAVPIYNYDVNAAAKNLIELTDDAWNDKLVGFLCAAGGKSSYMAIMSLANSLMLDFRCLILPRFVYSVSDDFGEDEVTNPKVKERVSKLGRTPLHWAAEKGFLKIAKYLIRKGATINAADNEGETPLHDAVQWGNKQIVELLISKKANINKKGSDGRAPLHKAIASGNIDIVNLLKSHGALL